MLPVTTMTGLSMPGTVTGARLVAAQRRDLSGHEGRADEHRGQIA